MKTCCGSSWFPLPVLVPQPARKRATRIARAGKIKATTIIGMTKIIGAGKIKAITITRITKTIGAARIRAAASTRLSVD